MHHACQFYLKVHRTSVTHDVMREADVRMPDLEVEAKVEVESQRLRQTHATHQRRHIVAEDLSRPLVKLFEPASSTMGTSLL